MKKILILVEGQTEERFVKDILNGSLSGVFFVPIIISTKIVKTGAKTKGGVTTYSNVKRDLHNLLPDTSAVAVTTLIDFYGLPSDFPKWDNELGTANVRVLAAEDAFSKDIGNDKFIAHFQLHEFEGMLFSAPELIAEVLGGPHSLALRRVRDAFQSPEEINHGPTTHPSQRIISLYPSYQKVPYGSLIAGRAGLDCIRRSCPHFDAWLNKLSSL